MKIILKIIWIQYFLILFNTILIFAQDNIIKVFAISSFTNIAYISIGYENSISEHSSIEFVIDNHLVFF